MPITGPSTPRSGRAGTRRASCWCATPARCCTAARPWTGRAGAARKPWRTRQPGWMQPNRGSLELSSGNDNTTTGGAAGTTAVEPPLVLTIDIGSSSTRVLLYDSRGRPVEGVSAHERYNLQTAAGGAAEDDPDAALERVARCV